MAFHWRAPLFFLVLCWISHCSNRWLTGMSQYSLLTGHIGIYFYSFHPDFLDFCHVIKLKQYCMSVQLFIQPPPPNKPPLVPFYWRQEWKESAAEAAAGRWADVPRCTARGMPRTAHPTSSPLLWWGATIRVVLTHVYRPVCNHSMDTISHHTHWSCVARERGDTERHLSC